MQEPMPPPRAGVALFPSTAVSRRLTRLRTWLHRSQLDAALTSGIDPWSDAELVVRATQLSALRTRRQLAASLEKLVMIAENPRPDPPSRCVRLRRRAVLEQRARLLALAARVRAPAPVAVAVLAHLRLLLGEASSPLYRGGAPAEGLATALNECFARLDPSIGWLAH
jgi:hypothetical protein